MRRATRPPVRGFGGACVVALAVLLAARGAAHAQRLPGDTIEVRSLTFDGASSFSAELLRSAIMTAPTRCVTVALQPLCWLGVSRDRRYLDRFALRADSVRLLLFYRDRGYREASVAIDTTRVPGGVHVRFRIDEGRPVLVNSVRVEVPEELSSGLTRNLPLRVRRPFSRIAFEATRDTLVTRLANRGYAAADALASFEIRADDRYSVDVEYVMVPGPLTVFGPITITGTDRVADDVVHRMLVIDEGDTYSRQALIRSQRNLFSLEVFRHAEIATAPPTETDSVLPVEVRVIEGDMHRVRVGIGVSTADYVSAEGRWVSRNFLGGGRRLELRGRLTNMIPEELGSIPIIQGIIEHCSGIYCDIAGSLNADFSQPWFFGPQNAIGAGLFLERFTLPGVYVRTSRGGYASLRRTLLGNSQLTAVYRRELTELDSDGDLIFCVNFTACEEREIDVLRDPHWLSPLSLSFARDRSNSLFAPTRGYIVRAEAEYAGTVTGSDYSHTRLLGEASYYHDPFRGVVYATRLRLGWARAAGEPGSGLGLHPQKRFFAGGPNSVRGFAQYRLGPKLLTANAVRELALPADSGGAGCTAQQINAGTCDATPIANRLDDRPVGGAVMLEGNLEIRFPVWREFLRGATFIDIGQVWRSEENVKLSQLQWTPGVGIRYFSPIGPIRIDVGFNPGSSERLTVVTTEVCDRTQTPCADIMPGVTYARDDLENRRKLRTLPSVVWKPYESFRDRLQFHFSIGQAF